MTGVTNIGGVRSQIAATLGIAEGGGELVICIDGQESAVKQLSELGTKAKVNVYTADQFASLKISLDTLNANWQQAAPFLGQYPCCTIVQVQITFRL